MGLTPRDPLAGLKALQRRSALRDVTQAFAPEQMVDKSTVQRTECNDWIAHSLGGQQNRNNFGDYVTISRWFAEPMEAVDTAALRLLWPEAPDSIADPQQWLFLDTETTGLAGGTGTYAFLIGIAWWDAAGIQVEQYFMRDLNEEWPVLSALAVRLERRPVLVTFNGKSFDWPLLETRYRMTRTIAPPEPHAHLDFLHPARNVWRPRLGSVRLTDLEREVLGWDRGEDLSSDLIPQSYLEFLRGGSPEPLIPIFRHNQMDLRALAALSCRVLSLVANPETCAQNSLDLYGVSRIYERRGELKLARNLYECSVASFLPSDEDRAARTSLARLAKRDGDYTVALSHWQKALGTSKQGLHAYEQLAIYYEHHAREPLRAMEITRQALAELRRAHRLGTIAAAVYQQAKTKFEHRLARLERKAGPTMIDSLFSHKI